MDKKRFPEPFMCCEYIVEDFIKEADFKEVNMLGMCETLQELKNSVEDIFQPVNHMTYDIEYHGWHGETAANMRKIEKELVKRLLEIYIICQMALGEDIYEKQGDNV